MNIIDVKYAVFNLGAGELDLWVHLYHRPPVPPEVVSRGVCSFKTRKSKIKREGQGTTMEKPGPPKELTRQ